MNFSSLKTVVRFGVIALPPAAIFHEYEKKKQPSGSLHCIFQRTISSRNGFTIGSCNHLNSQIHFISNQSQIDCFFLEIKKDFKHSQNFSCVEALLENINGEAQAKTANYIAKQLILLLRQDVLCNSLTSLISYIYFRTHPISMGFSELKRDKLQELTPLFQFVDRLISKMDDQKLIDEIKVLFSNLPFKGNRKEFLHLFLSENEQIKILFKALQKKEDDLVNEYINRLQEPSVFISSEESRILQKLLYSNVRNKEFSLDAELSEGNKTRLINAWMNRQQSKQSKIILCFAQVFEKLDKWERIELSILPENHAKVLQRVLKCKSYFKEQIDDPKENFSIPFWYHSTKKENLNKIIMSENLNVYYKKGAEPGYTGAWVSSHVESHIFGRYSIGFSKKIEELEKDSRTSLPLEEKRWRGFLQPLPFKNVKILSVRKDKNKEKHKQEKQEFKEKLKLITSSSCKVVSERQIAFMQKEITSILGLPNLSDRLWGYHY